MNIWFHVRAELANCELAAHRLEHETIDRYPWRHSEMLDSER